MNRKTLARHLATLVTIFALAGCAGTPEYFSVGANGGAMTVRSRDAAASGAMIIDAKHPMAMHDGRAPRDADIDNEEFRRRMGRALDAQPLPPQRYTLNFVEGSDVLTAESQTAITAVLAEIQSRPVPDVVVIGHTDRVGTVAANDQLAIRRAQMIRDRLVKLGIDAESIQTAGRGEREPLVPTADEVPEPRNRRVDIMVR